MKKFTITLDDATVRKAQLIKARTGSPDLEQTLSEMTVRGIEDKIYRTERNKRVAAQNKEERARLKELEAELARLQAE